MARPKKAKSKSQSSPVDKPPRKTRKTKSTAPGADQMPGIGHNSDKRSAEEVRKLFLHHREPWRIAQANLTLAKKRLATVVADLKNDKFTKKQFEIADALDTISGEARITHEVSERLQVARWINHPMGAQLDMFNEPDRTPLVDRAYEEGKMASMSNKPAKPGNYAPGTEGYAAYLEGFHDHQGKLAAGIKAPPVTNGISANGSSEPAAV